MRLEISFDEWVGIREAVEARFRDKVSNGNEAGNEIAKHTLSALATLNDVRPSDFLPEAW